MNKKSFPFFIVIIFILFTGCDSKSGSGNIVTETRNTGSFDGVSVSGNFNVEIKKGSKEQVIIEADDNLIKNIETTVTGGTLRIRTSDNNLHDPHFKVFITAMYIDNLSASASAIIDVKDILVSERELELDASSAAIINTAIDAPEVSAEASSGGELNLSGRTKTLKATTSSGASIKAMNLLSERSIVNSSSGATAKVHASISLDASASSGSNISYRGGANVKKSTSSGAEVEKE